MRLLRCYTKPARGGRMRHSELLCLRAGEGIVGDCNRACGSPRQVLIASEPVYRALGLEPGTLRENFLVDGEIERFRSGQVLRIGNEALVRLTIPCEPCAKLNRARPGLAREVAGRRGFLARVVTGGSVRAGDQVELTDSVFEPMPVSPRERVYDVVARIPPGQALGFKALVKTVGLPKTYVRVMPKFLTGAPPHLPVHRVVTSDRGLILRHVPEQSARLMGEGVRFTPDGRVQEDHLWDPVEYFGPETLPI